ncbi:hypothetical protein [Methylocella sp.]|uniref:hypothetical protein n=1 Tax=Methylocella sp. TaxID=1978226 RepID=UPI0035AF679B
MARSLTLAVLAVAALAAQGPALAEDTPFAQPTDAGAPALADIMSLAQLRHIKLGLAAEAGNLPLAAFEARTLAQSLGAAAIYYANIPIDYVIAAAKPLKGIVDAAARGDGAAVKALTRETTAACNACHVAAGRDFIRLRPPTSSPFADQIFAPE